MTATSENSFEEALARAMAKAAMRTTRRYDTQIIILDMTHDADEGYSVTIELCMIPISDKDRFKIKSDEELNRVQKLRDFRKLRAGEGDALKRLLEDHFRARGYCPEIPLAMAGTLSEADVVNGGVERRLFGLARHDRDPLSIEVASDVPSWVLENEEIAESAFWQIGRQEEEKLKELMTDMFGRAGEAAYDSDAIERKFEAVISSMMQANDFAVEKQSVSALEERMEWMMRKIWAQEKAFLKKVIKEEFKDVQAVDRADVPEPEEGTPDIYAVLGARPPELNIS